MSDPVRLLREGATDFERELLGSWEHERPSARARRRALAIAGSGVVTTIAASAGAQAAQVAGTIAPKMAVGSVIAKWLSIGAAVGFATSAATIQYVDSRSSIEESSIPTVVTTSSPIHEERAPVMPVTRAEPEPLPPVAIAVTSEPAKPRDSRARVMPTATVPAPEPPPVARGGLGPETALLDRAREALRSGNASRALELVGEYQRTFANGVLAQEAEVLRIDALDRQGNRSEAKQSAARFVTRNPTSAHAERLKRLSDDATIP